MLQSEEESDKDRKKADAVGHSSLTAEEREEGQAITDSKGDKRQIIERETSSNP